MEDKIQQLIKAKEAYYNNKPIMTDEEFDLLEEELREIDPDNDYFKLVGAPVDTRGKKVVHKFRMKSMDKGKSPVYAIKWLSKINVKEAGIVKLAKVDGVSATIKYNKGELVYIATRGDGVVGQDITHIADHLDTIPKTISFTKEEVEVRGELVLPVDTAYEMVGPRRNNTTGLINRESDTSQTHYLKFIAYGLIGSEYTSLTVVLDRLRKEGFKVVEWDNEENIEEYYNSYVNNLRSSWEYDTDGIVLAVDDLNDYKRINSIYKDNNHHWFTNFALKPPSKTKTSTLEDISWRMSRNGNLIPVGEFKTVQINGANISRATLNNLENVTNLKLNIGDQITVVLANEVIPGILENISINKTRNLTPIPDNCPHCQTPLIKKGVHLHCPNKQCEEQIIQKIIYWVKESDTENVAEGTLRALFNKGVLKSIKDLYTLTAKDLQGIEGFQDKKINTFIEGFQQNKELTPVELLSKLNIPLVRKKALTKLNIKSVKDFLDFNRLDSAIARNVVEWKDDDANMELLNELLTVITLREPVLSTSKVLGLVCMTGKCDIPRKELTNLVNNKGYEVTSSVTKSTTILLTNDINGSSSKLVKARKLGVEVRTYEEFFGV